MVFKLSNISTNNFPGKIVGRRLKFRGTIETVEEIDTVIEILENCKPQFIRKRIGIIE